MKVTQQQLAQRLGISQMAVSYALNGKPGVNATTRQRVLDTARRLGYRTNAAGRSMRTGRFGHVAMLTRSDVHHLQFNLNKGVTAELARHDLHMTYVEADMTSLADPDRAPRLFREHCVDGLIIHLCKAVPTESIALLQRLRAPVVWANTRSESDCVYPDERQGFALATRQLLEAGHQRILFVRHENGVDPHYSRLDREAGYGEAMRGAGFDPLLAITAEAHREFDPGLDYWRGQLETLRPTAVLAPAPGDAGIVMMAALSLGWRIPRDLSVIALHAVRPKGDFGPAVSTLTPPMIAVGREAVRMLMEKLRDPDTPLPSRSVPYRPVDGRTVAPPRGGA